MFYIQIPGQAGKDGYYGITDRVLINARAKWPGTDKMAGLLYY